MAVRIFFTKQPEKAFTTSTNTKFILFFKVPNIMSVYKTGWSVFPCFYLKDPGLNYNFDCFSPYRTARIFPGIILWGFPPTSRAETFFLVFSPLGFLASTVIKLTLLRVFGFTTTINEILFAVFVKDYRTLF